MNLISNRKLLLAFCAFVSGTAFISGAAATSATPVPKIGATIEIPLPVYTLPNTEILQTPALKLAREYEAYVALPRDYDKSTKKYPVLYATDAGYAFPLIRAIAARVRDHGVGLEDFILVGLSYAKGENGVLSRNRDYTAAYAANKVVVTNDTKGGVYGQADAYLSFLKQELIPAIEKRYRVDTTKRIYVGHSYGSLLGIHSLFTSPQTFTHYILGSPSLWFDAHRVFEAEKTFASAHTAMPAKVRFYIGEYEQIKKGNSRYYKTRDMVGDLDRFVKQISARRYKGLDIQRAVLPDEDHATVFPALVTRGLMWALPAP